MSSIIAEKKKNP